LLLEPLAQLPEMSRRRLTVRAELGLHAAAKNGTCSHEHAEE
jgi:hypothetical protein